MTLSTTSITNIVKAWANDWYQDLGETIRSPKTDKDDLLDTFLDEQRDTRSQYANADFSKVSNNASSLINESNDIEATPNALAFTSEQILIHKDVVLTTHINRLKYGQVSPIELYPSDLKQPTSTKETVTISNGCALLLSEVFEKYADEMRRTAQWTNESGYKASTQALTTWYDVIGDKAVSTITKEDARNFKASLYDYPAHRSKGDNQTLSIEEIKARPSYQTISSTTMKKHYDRIKTILKWCSQEGYCDMNPMQDMEFRIKRESAKDKRHPFTEGELKALFGTKVFTQGKYQNSYYYWLPLLGLYTGARIEELCQLHLADIREIEGVLCINIDDREGDKHLKNQSSRRAIPVHDDLTRLGLTRHIERLKTSGHTRLFPELLKQSEKYSHAASKWFGRYKKDLGLGEGKVFHSFRHTMADMLTAVSPKDSLTKLILGHTDGSVTMAVYGSNDPRPLKVVIDKLDLSSVIEGVKPYIEEAH